ncbi:MAG: hypothetical protein K2V38_18660, partial [Gemmataceae bacterium]|nr:hypothetical protein [Gemmataceae bacterium]
MSIAINTRVSVLTVPLTQTAHGIPESAAQHLPLPSGVFITASMDLFAVLEYRGQAVLVLFRPSPVPNYPPLAAEEHEGYGEFVARA